MTEALVRGGVEGEAPLKLTLLAFERSMEAANLSAF